MTAPSIHSLNHGLAHDCQTLKDTRKVGHGRDDRQRDQSTYPVDGMNALSVRREENNITNKKVIPSSGNPHLEKNRASTPNASSSSSSSSSSSPNRTHESANIKGKHPQLKTATNGNRKLTASSERLPGIGSSGVQKIHGKARSSRAGGGDSSSGRPHRSPTEGKEKSKCRLCQRDLSCKLKVVVHGVDSVESNQSWSLLLDRDNQPGENILSTIIGRRSRWRYHERRGVGIQPAPRNLLVVKRVGEITTPNIANYAELVMYDPAANQTYPYEDSHDWCVSSLELLRDMGMIAIDLETVGEDLEQAIFIALAEGMAMETSGSGE